MVINCGYKASAEHFALLSAVREGAEKADRSLGELDMTIEVKVSFDHDRDADMETIRYWGALGLTPE